MLQGLKEVERALAARGIGFVMRAGEPAEVALGLAKQATVVVCDRGYLRHQKAWRERRSPRRRCPVLQVEGDVVVPVEIAAASTRWRRAPCGRSCIGSGTTI